MRLTDEFGFLLHEITFASDKCEISTLRNHKKQKKNVKKYINREGFLEPPCGPLVTMTPAGRVIKRSKLKSIAWMYKVPISHSIKLDSKSETSQGARVCELGFIMHLLAYLYGCRLQFKDWWVDGFVPLAGKHNISVTRDQLHSFLQHAVSLCYEWEKKKIVEFNRILFMHMRSPGYKWDWERFMMEYAVFDSMWRFDWGPRAQSKRKEPTHSNRMKILCEKYGLFKSDKLIEEIVDLRTDLFHEAKWDKGFPCHTKGNNGFMHAYNLRRLNQRLVCALLGFQTNYIRSNWTCIGCFSF